MWERIKQYEQESGNPGGRRGAISGHAMSVCKRTWMEVCNNIVYALPLVDSWPFSMAHGTPWYGHHIFYYGDQVPHTLCGEDVCGESTETPLGLIAVLLATGSKCSTTISK